jgi:hypothetical protein
MQPNSSKYSYEIWVMYQIIKSKISAKGGSASGGKNISDVGKKIIITAWKYPGKSPVKGNIPIPPDILEELEGIING